jgi:hypothetical protein
MAALVAAEREAQKSRRVKEAAALADRLHDEWICRRRDGRPVRRYSTAYWNARARLARRREALVAEWGPDSDSAPRIEVHVLEAAR